VLDLNILHKVSELLNVTSGVARSLYSPFKEELMEIVDYFFYSRGQRIAGDKKCNYGQNNAAGGY